MWGATTLAPPYGAVDYISIHAPRVGSDCTTRTCIRRAGISIHAPRVGSDPEAGGHAHPAHYFNPRSPCGERRGPSPALWTCTPISIHAPRVGSDGTAPAPGSQRSISIHAPRVGSDDFFDEEVTVLGHFNPRSPCGERPEASVEILKKSLISIHAPRVGSDHHQRLGHQARLDFNPRSPCGERRTSNRGPAQGCGFQSTLPVWGATAPQPSGRMAGRISIHAPRVGSDVVAASL